MFDKYWGFWSKFTIEHNQEEADGLAILHCFDITKTDLFREVFVACPDADVLIILLYALE